MRVSHVAHNCLHERVCATKHTPRNPFYLLGCLNGFADVVERGAAVREHRPRVINSHHEREIMIFSKNAARHGHVFTQQRPSFFELT